MVRLEVAAMYVGVNLLILLVLAAVVIRWRRTHKIVLGDGADRGPNRAIRAHANASEYIPGALVGIVLLALLEPGVPIWVLHAAGLCLTFGRIFHGVGLNLSALNFGRVAGMVLTLTSYLIISLGLIAAALAQAL